MIKKNKIRLAFLGVMLLTLWAAFFSFPAYYHAANDWMKETANIRLPKIVSDKPFHLGLDLQGGTHLVYEADMSNVPLNQQSIAIEGVRDVLERRVNAFGVSEPIVQTSRSEGNWNVLVELAGVMDVNEAIEMIGETPWLEFRIENTSTTTPELTAEESRELDEYNADARNRAQEVLGLALDSGRDFGELAREYSEEPNANETSGILGMASRGQFVPEFESVCYDDISVGEIYPEIVATDFGFHVVKKLEESGDGDEYSANCQHILIRTKTIFDIHPVEEWVPTELSGEHLERAQVTFNQQTGEAQVSLEFDNDGKELFKNITTENVGNYVAIFLDGSPISIPVVNEPITGGSAVISGNFTLPEAKLLAQRLNAGALKVPITLISQQTVGPTLGRISVEKSLNAALLGLIIVGIFMILYYRMLGLLANFALLSYGFLVLTVFKMVPVTLTLAGIAGFILSIGMAVDANILIFERIKEELRYGKGLDRGIAEGFKRAWPSIRDGNLSTLITSIILVWFSTSVVKGFAITLIFGILVSMFSAMVISRVIIVFTAQTQLKKYPWLFGARRSKKVSKAENV